MSWSLLALGLVSIALTAVSLRPVRWPTALGLLSFWFAWTTADLPVLHLIVQGGLAVWLVVNGALDAWPGWVGFALLVVSFAGLARAHAIAETAQGAMDRALEAAGVPDPAEDWSHHLLLRPFPMFGRHGVRVKRNVAVHREGWWSHRVDVFHPADPLPEGAPGRPVLVFAHGGGWVMSFREFQGLPVIHRLVERGWVVVRTTYRLSPLVRFPDHLIDVKRAIAWTRENAHRWGGDPDRFLGLHGNSAGAHLAALAALTPNDPRYQLGFEEADTSVDACVPVYAPLDARNRHGDWGFDFDLFMRLLVIGRPKSDEAVWSEASPIDRIASGAPPFFLVHGELDTLVPVNQSLRFAEAMRAAGNAVDLAVIPGGQHALDIFHSRRGVAAADGIVRWLVHQERQASEESARRSHSVSIP